MVGNLRNLLNKTVIYNNTQPIIHMTKNQMHHEQNKYMHFIKNLVPQGFITIRKYDKYGDQN